MACDPLTFELDEATYQKLYQQAVDAGALFQVDLVHLNGMLFSWKREGTTLTVTCQHKPFYIPCGAIAGKMRELVGKAVG